MASPSSAAQPSSRCLSMAPRPPTLPRDWEEPPVDRPLPRLSLLVLVLRAPQDADCLLASLAPLQVLEALALVSARPSPAALLASAALPQASAAGEDPLLVDLVRFDMLIFREKLTDFLQLASLLPVDPQVSADLPASEDLQASPLAVAATTWRTTRPTR